MLLYNYLSFLVVYNVLKIRQRKYLELKRTLKEKHWYCTLLLFPKSNQFKHQNIPSCECFGPYNKRRFGQFAACLFSIYTHEVYANDWTIAFVFCFEVSFNLLTSPFSATPRHLRLLAIQTTLHCEITWNTTKKFRIWDENLRNIRFLFIYQLNCISMVFSRK